MVGGSGGGRVLTIEAITDAAWSRFGERDVPVFGVAREFAQHDLQIVKPALLYGDEVILRTGNFLLMSQYRAFDRQLYMPQRLVWLMAFLSRGPLRSQLNALGLSSSELPLESDAQGVLDQWHSAVHAPSDDDSSVRTNFLHDVVLPATQRWDAYFDRFVEVVSTGLADAEADLFSEELEPAIDAGILEIRPHTEKGPNLSRTPDEFIFGEHPEEYQIRSLHEVIDRLSDPLITPLLDPWSAEVARIEDLIDEAALRSFAASFGVSLLARTAGVRNATVPELLDIRDEISEELTDFRAAMFDASEAFLQSDAENAEGWIRDYTIRVIQPTLSEIDRSIRADSYMKDLLQTVGDPKELIAPAGTLIIAAATGVGALGALVASGIGLAMPLLKARSLGEERRDKIHSNKLFLLHRMERGA